MKRLTIPARTVFAALCVAIATQAQAEKPAIQAWSELGYSCEDPKVELPNYRWLTGLHVAMYFAGSAVDPRYDLGLELPQADASADEAAAAAGRAFMAKVCDLDTSEIAKPQSETAADLNALAEAAAAKTMEMMQATISEEVPYRPFAQAGIFVPTRIPGDNYTAHLAHFAYDPKLATQIAPPPALDSDEYAASFNETKRVGAIKDAERTEEQSKATIVFDLQNPHPMIFRILENRDLSLFEQARVMAIYDLATDDVMLAQFAGKLHFQSWRPITAIRRAELDGRDDTDVDLGWQAFLDTPNSSEYPCGHCTFVAASAEVLKVLLPLKDGEKIVITAEDMYHDPKERGVGKEMRKALEGYEMRYESWDAFAEAGGLSRIHNGAHFRYSLNAGMALGKSVAKANLQKWDGIED